MKDSISLLLGSGFSVSDGYPTGYKLNEFISKIQYDDIILNSDGSAFIDIKDKYPNNWMSKPQRVFFERLLNYYKSIIKKKNREFDYEKFYDFYKNLQRNPEHDTGFKKLCEEYTQEYYPHFISNPRTYLLNFDTIYNQIIQQKLTKRYKRSHIRWNGQGNYGQFLLMLESLSHQYKKINIHSLNHDLLMEHLAFSDELPDKFCDGFTELGSPFYGRYKEESMIRLQCFSDLFNKQLCLYKLHGSVDYVPFLDESGRLDIIKTKPWISNIELFKEVNDSNSNPSYYNYWANYHSYFLTGTTEKINRYKEPFFSKMIDHFKINLSQASGLIVLAP